MRGAYLLLAVVVGSIVAVTVPGPARAAPSFTASTKVVLFTPSNTDPLVARLEAELAAVGITVRRSEAPPESQLDAAVTREIASGAAAVIRVIPRSRGTDVWTADTTARMLRRRSIKADTADAALSVTALRTVEFLRASLLSVKRRDDASGATPSKVAAADPASQREATSSDKPAPPDKTPAEKTPAPTPPPEFTAPAADESSRRPAERRQSPPLEGVVPAPEVPGPENGATSAKKTEGKKPRAPSGSHFEIAAGPALLVSPGGVGPVTAIAAFGRAMMTERLGMEILAIFPASSAHLTNPEGTTDISTALFGAGMALRLTPPGSWTVDAALGVSALMFRATGNATGMVRGAPYEDDSLSTWKLAANARVGAGVDITPWLALRADAIAGVIASQHIAVGSAVADGARITDETVRATWGPLFAAGTLALQATW
jgi:hypothetical protein